MNKRSLGPAWTFSDATLVASSRKNGQVNLSNGSQGPLVSFPNPQNLNISRLLSKDDHGLDLCHCYYFGTGCDPVGKGRKMMSIHQRSDVFSLEPMVPLFDAALFLDCSELVTQTAL